jgi:molybdopterin-guanine dinucleotide biosynthesis protein A
MIYHTPCVILSGGKSGRMGKDKSLLPFGGFSTLIEYQYNKLSKIFNQVYISSKSNKFDFKCEIIYDSSDISSPMVALDSIFNFIEQQKVFIITVDTPLIKLDTILTLIEYSKNFDITIAKDRYKLHNLCGVFSVNLKTMVKQSIAQNNHKINNLIKQNNNLKIVQFSDDGQFINLNTQDQYQAARNIIKV